ncbi:hypothetical protein NDU88_003209 [Pleurodeles waltl]|uniref:Uncharacterized protein n=1 Tax=Pleurodeles waltl TaxID=8319 RepID=A0AAV7W6Q4_PLEWA|nr:hypothetical protein NDU88_003209 [Pleurodeles waltl]
MIGRAVHSQACRTPLGSICCRPSHTAAAATLFAVCRLQHLHWSCGGAQLVSDGAQGHKDSPDGTGEAQPGGQCREER